METNNKLREALTRIEKLADDYEQCGTKAGALDAIYELAHVALSVPVKNCEVGTVMEQKRRFSLHCLSLGNRCTVCPLFKERDCKLAWAQMPYEEGGAK